ncbi:phosphotransferase family protein [Cohnella zeiphila]|uniref:Phosphotransferase n=1 Tax=Cohnella zeiphila TaxID=2761120 RepID=A0A7X0VTV5_9BACL|nr:phosphotransferase [Cohnella zeiphila]MBB6730329.1 phosphotransferase [Cohnella zeiphila]
MDEHWERTYPFRALTEAEVNERLEAIDRSLRVDELVPMAEGKRNTNYRVRLRGSGSVLLLRLFVPGDDGWRKEAALRKLLEDRVPMQRMLAAGDRGDKDDRAYGIYEFVEGQTLLERIVRDGQAPVPALARELGRTLAAIHSVRFERHGFLDERLNVSEPISPLREWYPMFLNDRARKRLGDERSERILKLAESCRPLLDGMDRRTARLVHGDFRPTNLIVRDGRVAAVIDWEFAMASHPAGDWGQLFRYAHLFDAESKKAFAAGYEEGSGERLPPSWEVEGALRDLANLLQMLGDEESKPNKEADLIRLISASVRRLEQEAMG